jgi:hypothetical protein
MGLSSLTMTNSRAAFTLERQSRDRSDSYGSQERRAVGSPHRGERQYLPTSGTPRVTLTLTVDESEWARARCIVMRGGGSDIEVLRVVPVARTSELRIQIGLQSDALDATMYRIMRSLKAAEFGPVTPPAASRTRPSLTAVKKYRNATQEISRMPRDV